MFEDSPLLTFEFSNLRMQPAGCTVAAGPAVLHFRPGGEPGRATAEVRLEGVNVLSLERLMSDVSRLASFATYNTVRWQGWTARTHDGKAAVLERKGRSLSAYNRAKAGLWAPFDPGERGAVPTPELGEFLSAALGPYRTHRDTLHLPLTLLQQATLFAGPPEARVMLLASVVDAFKARAVAAAGRPHFLEPAAYDRIMADSGLAKLVVHLLQPPAAGDLDELMLGLGSLNRRSSDLVLQRLFDKHDVRELDDDGRQAVPFRLQPFLTLRDLVLYGSPSQIDAAACARICDRTEFALHALVFRQLGFILEWSVDQGALQFVWQFDEGVDPMARIY